MQTYMTPTGCLPTDYAQGTLVGRVWLPGRPSGPAIVAVRGQEVVDLSPMTATMSELINTENRVEIAQSAKVPVLGSIEDVLSETARFQGGDVGLRLLAPLDLSAVKAAGVTFVKSMLERVIEEWARGDSSQAEEVRTRVEKQIGGDLRAIKPGSSEALALKDQLIEKGLWSQYLEVGIGEDVEIFTKAQPMSSVGHGADIGIHPRSQWNNPEPEVVLIVNARAQIVGGTLGNDVNLRDFEGRSALLLGKAKDNNASSAIGPFIRLFDDGYGPDDLRQTVVSLRVEGEDGFVLDGSSSMAEISRDINELVAATFGSTHQYPDGAAIFCGTMFAPTKDRAEKGSGFTHKAGDLVVISAPSLGSLANRVGYSDQIAPWVFGTTKLMHNLAARGLLTTG